MTGSASPVGQIDRLDAIEDIALLKARYFRLMDTKAWAEWETLFAPHAVMDMRGEAAGLQSLGFQMPAEESLIWRGAGQIRQGVEAALVGVITVHHGHMGEVDILSPIAARAIWAMEDVIRYTQEAPVAGYHGFGHYHETYVKQAGAWKIETLKLTRLLVAPVPHAGK